MVDCGKCTGMSRAAAVDKQPFRGGKGKPSGLQKEKEE